MASLRTIDIRGSHSKGELQQVRKRQAEHEVRQAQASARGAGRNDRALDAQVGAHPFGLRARIDERQRQRVVHLADALRPFDTRGFGSRAASGARVGAVAGRLTTRRVASLLVLALLVSAKALLPVNGDRDASTDTSEANNNAPARMLIEDLKIVGSEGGQSSVRDTKRLLRALAPADSGQLALKIADRVLRLDPRPSPGSKSNFTDFFLALHRAIGGLPSDAIANAPPESALRRLAQAHADRDLDLVASRLSREVQEIAEIKPFSPRLGEASFTRERKRYIIGAVANMLSSPPRPSSSIRTIAPDGDARCARRRRLVAPSLTPFKSGDLDRTCEAKVARFAAMGFRRIALFQTVHFAGSLYGSTTQEAPPARPKEGIDFRFETLNAPSPREVMRCVGAILDAGLDLTYLVHLESIVTMNAVEEAEWRIHSAIPPDNDRFYALAYAPLVHALNERKERVRGRISISIGAENDKAVTAYPDALGRFLSRLEGDLSLPRSGYEWVWNPNGDFFVLGSFRNVYEAREIDGCRELSSAIGRVDTIAPSTYDGYGHVAPGLDSAPESNGSSAGHVAPPSFIATRKLFFDRLRAAFDAACEGLGEKWVARFQERYSIGELSLQGPRRGYYAAFLEDALRTTKSTWGRMNLWNSEQPNYDPLASLPDSHGTDTRRQFERFLRCA